MKDRKARKPSLRNSSSKKKESSTNNNILYLVLFTLLCVVVIVARSYQLMVLKSVNDIDLIEYNEGRVERSSIMVARRGMIYDSKGRIIAHDATSYAMYALIDASWTEEKIGDPDVTAKILSQHIDLSRDEILDILLTSGVSQVEFGTVGANLTEEQKKAIEGEGLSGLVFVSHPQRHYVNDYFASHLIGYAQAENVEDPLLPNAKILVGQLGIEQAYDQILSGTDHYKIGDHHLLGRDIYLTLDARIQNYMEGQLQLAYKRYQPETMMAYVVDVDTGKLLTAAQQPTYNLNSLAGIDQEWQNYLTEVAIEPGSTMKILTMAVAQDLGAYHPGERFKSGAIHVYDQVIHDYNKEGWGEISFEEGLARSSNVGMVELVARMGPDIWIDELKKLGFGQSTRSGLANENKGQVDFDNPVSKIMSGFGQGISATPIQLMQAYLTIANQGEMIQIQYIDHLDGEEVRPRKKIGQVLSPEACQKVLGLMVDTVEADYGTAIPFRNAQVKVAAKTGTAEIADPSGFGYLTGPNDYFFSVVAFFPAEDPQYMVYLGMKRPKETYGRLGTQILADLFHPLVDQILLGQ